MLQRIECLTLHIVMLYLQLSTVVAYTTSEQLSIAIAQFGIAIEELNAIVIE